jgi:hypothetical protein
MVVVEEAVDTARQTASMRLPVTRSDASRSAAPRVGFGLSASPRPPYPVAKISFVVLGEPA